MKLAELLNETYAFTLEVNMLFSSHPYKHVEVFRNPSQYEIDQIGTSVRGWLTPKGDFYVWHGHVLHYDLLPALSDKLKQNLSGGIAVHKEQGSDKFVTTSIDLHKGTKIFKSSKSDTDKVIRATIKKGNNFNFSIK